MSVKAEIDHESRTNFIETKTVGDNFKVHEFQDFVDENSLKQFKYLKNVFITSSINALQSKTVGPWIRLKEVLNLLAPFHLILCKSKKACHYVLRLYNYIETHNDENINQVNLHQTLKETFPNINFEKYFSKSIDQINSRSTSNCPAEDIKSEVNNENKIVLDKQPLIYNENVFIVGEDDLKNRVYEPKPLIVSDLQKYLPRVVSDLAKLESVWNNALGITLTSINTDLPEDIIAPDYSPSPTQSYCSTSTDLSPPVNEKKRRKKPKNGREVVEYLVRTSHTNTVEIWYLDFAESKRYEPYNLIVSSKKNVKKEHVVISIFGVLYVRNGGKSEITPLGQWYMEAVCFETISTIPFFKHFLNLKVLRKWQNVVKHGQFLRTRKNIAKAYLFRIPSIPRCLLEIQNLIYQINMANIIPEELEMPTTFNTFKKRLTKQLTRFNKFTCQLVLFSQNVINNCFDECLQYYKYCAAQLNAMRNSMKASMAITRKQTKCQEKNLKAALENLLRLKNFVKLISNLIHSNLVSLLTKQIKAFVDNFISLGDGCFIVSLEVYNNKQLLMKPNISFIKENLEKLLFTALSSVDSSFVLKLPIYDITKEREITNENPQTFDELQALLLDSDVKEEKYDTVISKPETKCLISSPSISEAVFSQELVIVSLKELTSAFDKALQDSEIKFEELVWVTDIINFLQEQNNNTMQEWISGPAPLIEKQMVKLQTWLTKLQELSNRKECIAELITLDFTKCQEYLLPRLDKFFETFSEFLSRNTMKKSIELIKYLKTHVKKLTDPPTEVKEFTKYYTYIESLSSVVNEKQDDIDHTKAIYSIIKHCRRPLTTEEEHKEKQLINVWERFMFLLQNGKDHINAMKQNMVMQVEDEIKKLMKECLDIVMLSTSGRYLDADEDMSIMVQELKVFWNKFNLRMESLKSHNEEYKLLTSRTIDINDVIAEEKKIRSRFELWKYLKVATHTIKEWMQICFSKLNVSKMMDKLNDWKSACSDLSTHLSHDDKVMMKLKSLLEEFIEQLPILKQLSNPVLLSRHWKDIFVVLGHTYDENGTYRIIDILSMGVQNNFPKIQQICCAAMSENKLFQCLNKLIKYWEKKEFRFAKKMNERKTNVKHDFAYRLTGISDMMLDLEDGLVTLQSMLVSPHVADVRDMASFWSTQLQEIKEILSLWKVVQQEWLFLCNMFSDDCVRENHSNEYKIFIETNTIFKELIQSLMNESKVLNVLSKKNISFEFSTGTSNSLKQILTQLSYKQSIVIKKLEEYLSKIQDSFPRLYFLSKNEMLNLLAITRNIPALVPFVRKCFTGIKNMKFQLPTDNKLVTTLDMSLNVHLLEAVGFCGNYGEVIYFDEAFPSNSLPAEWLKTLEIKIKNCVKSSIFAICEKIESLHSLISCIISNQNMDEYLFEAILICCDLKVYAVLKKEMEKNELKECLILLQGEIKKVCEALQLVDNGDQKSKCILLLQNVVSKLLYWRDTCKSLCGENVDSFEFVQIYHYEITDNTMSFCSMKGRIEYGFEYMSPHSCFVTTPLTKKYMFTLLNTLSNNEVGCISGGLSSGKKSTVAELSKLLGRNHVVFNCSPHKSMSSILQYTVGALLSGSFLCIESIQKLSINILSVFGDYMSLIRAAFNNQQVKKAELSVKMDDRDVNIHPLFICCVTTDDDSINYWKVIPDNVKANLVVSSPLQVDTVYLFEAWLLLSGFNFWKDLARKLFLLHEGHKELLSIERIRNIIIYSKENIKKDCSGSHSEESHLVSLLLKVSVTEDVHHKMSNDIQMIFSENIETIRSSVSDIFLIDSVKAQLKSDNLVAKTQFVKKVLDLHDILTNHQSVMIYGASCSGKSTCYQVLSKALCQFYSPWSQKQNIGSTNQSTFEQVNVNVVFPNVFRYDQVKKRFCFHIVLSVGKDKGCDDCLPPLILHFCLQLYGYLDKSSSSWKDGLLTKLLRTMNVSQDSNNNKNMKETKQWLVLDGTILPEWVLPFECLLGPMKQFTFANGEIMSLGEHCKMIFETVDLSEVPPSTISKCPLLYFPSEQLVDWKCLFESWKITAYNKYTLPIESYTIIEDVLSYTLQPSINFIDNNCEKLFSPIKNLSSVITCGHILKIFSAILYQWKSRESNVNKPLDNNNNHKRSEDEEKNNLISFVCHGLAYSFSQSLPSLVNESYYPILDSHIRQLFSTCPHCPVVFPALIHDCYFNGETGELARWNSSKFDVKIGSSSSYIITEEVQKQIHLTNLLLSTNEHVLITGSVGCGKSVLVKRFLSNLYPINNIQMTSALSIEYFQESLKDKMKLFLDQQNFNIKLKNGKTSLKKERVKFFIDDLNLGFNDGHEKQGNVNCIAEQIRHVCMEGGFYDYNDKYFHHLSNVQFIASYTPCASDFVGSTFASKHLEMQLARNFAIVNISSSSADQLIYLYSKQCQNWIETLDWIPWKKPFSKVIASAIISIYTQVKQLEIPYALFPHLVFSQHDLAKAFKLCYQFVPNNTSEVLKYLKSQQNMNKSTIFKDTESSVNITFVEESVSEMLMENETKSNEEFKSKILEPFEEFVYHWRHSMRQIFSSRFHGDTIVQNVDEIIEQELIKTFGVGTTDEDDVDFGVNFQNETVYPIKLISCCKIVNKKNTFVIPQEAGNMKTNCRLFSGECYEKRLEDVKAKTDLKHLVLHSDFLRKVEKLSCSIAISGGHSILLSNNGWARQKVTYLAAALMNYQFIELNFNKNKDVVTVLKDACSLAGLKGRPVVLYVTEFICKKVLMYLISIIEGGVCHGLFTSNELSLICGQLLPGNLSSSRKSDSNGMQGKFFSRIQQNLRIVFAVELEKSSKLFQQYPPLVYKTISKICFANLTEENLKNFVFALLRKNMKLYDFYKEYYTEQYLYEIASMFVKLYLSMRKQYASSAGSDLKLKFSLAKLVESVSLFFKILKWKNQLKEKELSHYGASLRKVDGVKTSIEDIGQQIKELQPCLSHAQSIADDNHNKMKTIQDQFSKLKILCSEQLEKIKELQIPCETLKKEAQLDFEKASPLYNAAVASVDTIDQSTIDELKSYPEPPEIVKDVVDMLAIMFDLEEINWKENKLLLMRENLLRDLQSYDKDNMTEKIYKKLTAFVTSENHSEDKVENVSKAAYHLLQWLRAIHSYATIMRQLKPIQDKLKMAETDVEQAKNVLAKKKVEYADTKHLLEIAIENYKESVEASKSIENKIKNHELSKECAVNILNSMKPFSDHWYTKVEEIKESISSSVLDCIFVTMEICFGSQFYEHDWLSMKWQLEKICDSSEILKRSKHNYPSEKLCLEKQQEIYFKILKTLDVFAFQRSLLANVVAHFGDCFPLIIDPDGIAEKWISMLERDLDKSDLDIVSTESDINQQTKISMSTKMHSKLKIIKADDSLLEDHIEDAQKLATPLLIKNIERIHDSKVLLKLLSNYMQRKKTNLPDKFHEGEITCGNTFRLYLSTSVDPDYKVACLPYSKLIMIRLHVGCQGLRTELLQNTLDNEKPELLLKKQRIHSDLSFINEEKNVLLDSISLKVLSYDGPILEDNMLLEYMSFQRESYWLIGEKYAEFKRVEENIKRQVAEYESLSSFGVLTYVTLRKLQKAYKMYYISYKVFNEIFHDVLYECRTTKAASSCTLSRMDDAKNVFLLKLYQTVSMMLPKDDVIFLPLMVILEEMTEQKIFNSNELETFVSCFQSFKIEEKLLNEFHRPEWISKESWCRFCTLAKYVFCFNDLLKEICNNSSEWEEFFKLNVICKDLVLCKIGPRFSSVPELTLEDIEKSSKVDRLNIIVLPDENQNLLDPVRVLKHVSQTKAKIQLFSAISLCGDDDNDAIFTKVRHAFNQAFQTGGCLVIQNCHLVEKWPLDDIIYILNTFDDKYNEMSKKDIASTSFRLWFVTRDFTSIPQVLAHRSNLIYWKPSHDLINCFHDGQTEVENYGNVNEGYNQSKMESGYKVVEDCLHGSEIDLSNIYNDVTSCDESYDKVCFNANVLPDNKSWHICSTLQTIYSMKPKKRHLKGIAFIKQLMDQIISLKRNHSIVGDESIHSLVTIAIENEWKTTINHLEIFLQRLHQLIEVIHNKKACSIELMILWRDISNNLFTPQHSNNTLIVKDYFVRVDKKLTHLEYLLETDRCLFDMNCFDNPRELIHAIHLQLIKNSNHNQRLRFIYAEMMLTVKELANQIPLKSEAFLKNIKLYGKGGEIKDTVLIRLKLYPTDVPKSSSLDMYESVSKQYNPLFSLKCEPSLKDTVSFAFICGE